MVASEPSPAMTQISSRNTSAANFASRFFLLAPIPSQTVVSFPRIGRVLRGPSKHSAGLSCKIELCARIPASAEPEQTASTTSDRFGLLKIFAWAKYLCAILESKLILLTASTLEPKSDGDFISSDSGNITTKVIFNHGPLIWAYGRRSGKSPNMGHISTAPEDRATSGPWGE